MPSHLLTVAVGLFICQLAAPPAPFVVEAADSSLQIEGITYLRISSTEGGKSSYENYCAYADPRAASNFRNHYDPAEARSIIDLYPSDGCQRGNATFSGRVVIVARGHCDFVTKAVNAFKQNASGVIIVSSERYSSYITVVSPLLPSNYPVSLISKVSYQSIKDKFLAAGDGAKSTAAIYRPVDDLSSSKQYMFLVLYAIAMVTMVMSCVSAATFLRQYLLDRTRQANINGNMNADQELDSFNASKLQMIVFVAIIIAVPITILLLLYFAYDYFVWVMLVLYGYSIASSLVYYVNRIYLAIVANKRQSNPWLANTVEWDLGKCYGKLSYTYMEFVAYPFCLAVAVFWFVFRNAHWAFILTNILNILLVMRVIESLVLALRIKMVTILLIAFLVYDVFFVFITPLFSGDKSSSQSAPTAAPTAATTDTLSQVRRDTVMDYYIDRGGSVMEQVALGTAGMSGEIIPIVFKVMPYPPSETVSTCLLPYSILGLGDVILPAILLELNLFFDLAWSNRFWPYFSSSLVGYLVGLATCAGVLFGTGKGQPALLYIVPLILIASYLCAAIRHELKLYFHTALPDQYRIILGFEVSGFLNSGYRPDANACQEEPLHRD